VKSAIFYWALNYELTELKSEIIVRQQLN
jgi:hypothetical protein